MIRAIGRIIRLQQELRLQRTSCTEPPFNIMLDPRYRRVKFAGTESVKRSFRRGLGLTTSTSDVLTRDEEVLVLNSEAASVHHPIGLTYRLVYFFCRNLFIRGQDELRATHAGQFQLLSDGGVEFLRFVYCV